MLDGTLVAAVLQAWSLGFLLSSNHAQNGCGGWGSDFGELGVSLLTATGDRRHDCILHRDGTRSMAELDSRIPFLERIRQRYPK